MHMCANTEEDLATALENAGELLTSLDDLVETMTEVVEAGEKEANDMQKSFGSAGDPDASGLFQDAKVWAGKLLHAKDDGVAEEDELKEVEKKGTDSKGKDFSKHDAVVEAEKQ